MKKAVLLILMMGSVCRINAQTSSDILITNDDVKITTGSDGKAYYNNKEIVTVEDLENIIPNTFIDLGDEPDLDVFLADGAYKYITYRGREPQKGFLFVSTYSAGAGEYAIRTFNIDYTGLSVRSGYKPLGSSVIWGEWKEIGAGIQADLSSHKNNKTVHLVDLGNNPNLDNLDNGFYRYMTITGSGPMETHSYQLFQTSDQIYKDSYKCQIRFGVNGIYKRNYVFGYQYPGQAGWSAWEEIGKVPPEGFVINGENDKIVSISGWDANLYGADLVNITAGTGMGLSAIEIGLNAPYGAFYNGKEIATVDQLAGGVINGVNPTGIELSTGPDDMQNDGIKLQTFDAPIRIVSEDADLSGRGRIQIEAKRTGDILIKSNYVFIDGPGGGVHIYSNPGNIELNTTDGNIELTATNGKVNYNGVEIATKADIQSGGSSGGVIDLSSTSETLTGEIFNGKPVYAKAVQFISGNPPNFSLPAQEIDKIWFDRSNCGVDPFFVGNNGNVSLNFMNENTQLASTDIGLMLVSDNTDIIIWTSVSGKACGADVWVRVKYTKL